MNCCCFSPQEYGLILFCGSSDGLISIHDYKSNLTNISLDDNWTSVIFPAHTFGVTSISCGSSKLSSDCIYSNNLGADIAPLSFVSGGIDNLIKVWSAGSSHHGFDVNSFNIEEVLEGHDDVVRDVAWRPCSNTNNDIIASAGDVYRQSLN